MRIAIAGYEDTVSGAWQLSQTLCLFRLDFHAGEVSEEDVHPFPGVEAAAAWLKAQDVKAVLVGTIDPDHADPIADGGVHVFTGADGAAPAEIAHHFLQVMRSALVRGQGGGCCGGGHGAEESGCCGGHDHDEEESGCCGGGENCCGGTGHDDPDHQCQCR